MRVERCATAQEFLDRSLEYRALDPLRTNVIATVANGAVVDANRYDECFWWLVRDEQGHVAGAAFRTAPLMLALGPMTEQAVAAIAGRVAEDDAALPGLIGRPHQVSTFADAFASKVELGSSKFVVTRRDVLYLMYALEVPTTPGGAEVASKADFVLAESWLGAFAKEIDGVSREPNARSRAELLGILRDRRLYWWRDRGEIVSMACHNVTVSTPGARVTRIGPVFTPREHRRHGYGASVTGAVTAELLNKGSKVMLFADESNATSNSVYQSLGFRQVEVIVLASLRVGGAP